MIFIDLTMGTSQLNYGFLWNTVYSELFSRIYEYENSGITILLPVLNNLSTVGVWSFEPHPRN